MRVLTNKTMSVAAAAVLFCAGAVSAAPSSPSEPVEQPLPEVVIEAGDVNRTTVGRSASTNAPIESITVDYHVRYSDLDLIKHADVQTLQERIEAAARDACQQLDELFPLKQSPRQTRACIEDAIRAAAPQVQQVVEDVQAQGAGSLQSSAPVE